MKAFVAFVCVVLIIAIGIGAMINMNEQVNKPKPPPPAPEWVRSSLFVLQRQPDGNMQHVNLWINSKTGMLKVQISN